MARLPDKEKHAANCDLLKQAAERLAAYGQKITETALANETGINRVQLYSVEYKSIVHTLKLQYAPPDRIDFNWSVDEWKRRYNRLADQYKEKCKQCERLEAELKKAQQKIDRKRTN